MIQDLSVHTSTSLADPVGDRSHLGYTEKASAALGVPSVVGGSIAANGSEHDFFRALETLGAKSTIRRLAARDAAYRIVPVHVSCPYETWVNVFGEPESVTENHTTPTRLAVQVWEHRCEEGPVTCVGHIFDHLSGFKWVVLVRVGLFARQRKAVSQGLSSELMLLADAASGSIFPGGRSVGTEPVALQQTQHEFIEALQAVAGGPGSGDLKARYAGFSVVPVFVRCLYEKWVNEFGEPQSIVEYRNSSTGPALHVWKHYCTNGPVTCVGHLFECSSGLCWVILVRVGLI
jgi:hypothetical protein